jgi:hypothetical protein
MTRNRVENYGRPELSADRFTLATCGDPQCGIHVLGFRGDNPTPAFEITIGQESFQMLEGVIADIRYARSAMKD